MFKRKSDGIHSNVRPHSCPYCGKQFVTVDKMKRNDTVRKALNGYSPSVGSRTMKALGSRVTFVRRNSASMVTLSNTCSDMKVWSRMFAMNVQSVSMNAAVELKHH